MKIIEVALSDIRVPPDRLRPVDEAHAKAIGVSIESVGLLNPITLIKTPPATKDFKPYTLVAGAHRLRAFKLGPVYKVADRRHLRIAAMCSASRNDLASLS